MANCYNYLESMIETALEYIRDKWKYKERCGDGADFSSREVLEKDLNKELWWDVAKPFIPRMNVVKYLIGNLELLLEAADECDISIADIRKKGLYYADTVIRLYLLPSAIEDALDILEANSEISYSDDAVPTYIYEPATI